MPFDTLYDSVRQARNDALHHGAFARHLTVHALQMAIVLEDGLMQDASTVGEFMVRHLVVATTWQPVSFIRQTMLANSFSYLPVYIEEDEKPSWHLISDAAVAWYLRSGDRKGRLEKSLDAARKEGLQTTVAPLCTPDLNVADMLERSQGGPVLVHRRGYEADVLGIVTPFDIL